MIEPTVLLDPTRSVRKPTSTSSQTVPSLRVSTDRRDSGHAACARERSGRRAGVHGAVARAVQLAAHEPRQPLAVHPTQRPVHALQRAELIGGRKAGVASPPPGVVRRLARSPSGNRGATWASVVGPGIGVSVGRNMGEGWHTNAPIQIDRSLRVRVLGAIKGEGHRPALLGPHNLLRLWLHLGAVRFPSGPVRTARERSGQPAMALT